MKNFESIKVFLVMAISLIGFGLQDCRIKRLQDSNSSSNVRLNHLEAKIDSLLSKAEDAETIRALDDRNLNSTAADIMSASPFKRDAYGWWVADDAMFRFPKGIVVGLRNNFCAYGRATLSVNVPERLFADDGNCPEGDGSVAFGRSNTASGKWSSALGGYENTASGAHSSVSGGSENSASGEHSSVSGGSDNSASGDRSSIYGGEAVIKKELESAHMLDPPFARDAAGWWVADKTMFRFPKGVVVGARSSSCAYGEATLSVNGEDDFYANCPEGEGSVTFGRSNTASGEYSSVLAGYKNAASGSYSSVSGGSENLASGEHSSVSGGSNNLASGDHTSIYGGEAIIKKELESTNILDMPFARDAAGWWVADKTMFRFPNGVVVGARNSNCTYGRATLSVNVEDDMYGNCPEGEGSVTFGRFNTASGEYSSVLGGIGNAASGSYSSVSGGSENSAAGENSSISGGSKNLASSKHSSVYGGEAIIKKELESTNILDMPFARDAAGWWVADKTMFRFPNGVVVGTRNSNCTYGRATLSVNVEDDINGNCPEGDGSVTFGRSNTASGEYSSVLGGNGNAASGSYSSVSGGSENSAAGENSSISGGSKNLASGDHDSVYGGEAVIKKELESALVLDVPFARDVKGWWVADQAMFRFPKGVVVGAKSELCSYGEATLSVNGKSASFANCPEGEGSVAFGHLNTASGQWSSVLGGNRNTASGVGSSVSGGSDNTAFGDYSTVSAGSKNDATGMHSSVSGGSKNTASNTLSSVSGGTGGSASGFAASVSGGFGNNAAGGHSSITGGVSSITKGRYSSIIGGTMNIATGYASSVSGGYKNTANGPRSSLVGGKNRQTKKPYVVLA